MNNEDQIQYTHKLVFLLTNKSQEIRVNGINQLTLHQGLDAEGKVRILRFFNNGFFYTRSYYNPYSYFL